MFTQNFSQQPITDLIMERFDKFQNQHENGVPAHAQEPAPTANGAVPTSRGTQHVHSNKRKSAEDEDDLSEVNESAPPKKAKKIKPETETDEQIAKRMQAEINAQSGRSTRGGGNKRKPIVKKEKKVKKKKSKAKINSDDDSEVDGEGGEKPGR